MKVFVYIIVSYCASKHFSRSSWESEFYFEMQKNMDENFTSELKIEHIFIAPVKIVVSFMNWNFSSNFALIYIELN